MKNKVKKKIVGKKLSLIIPPKKTASISTNNVSDLEEALGGDKELVLFFLTWLKYDRNATRAYKELHPDCKDKSCGVLGARQLAKVSIDVILSGYGLGKEKYFEGLKEGLEAKKITFEAIGKYKNGRTKYKKIEEPDHTVRDGYHTKLGKILGIEGNSPTINVPIQVNNLINDKKSDYGI